MRPRSLAEVAHRVLIGGSFDLNFADFLDGFYATPSAESLAAEPALLAETLGEPGHVQDAFLAATAEKLAADHGLPIPRWVIGEARVLHRPWFASPLASLRAVLIHESPATFRARNLFVGQCALACVKSAPMPQHDPMHRLAAH